MSDEQANIEKNANDTKPEEHTSTVGMEAVNRITKLPVVESTINAATNMYEKVKDSNSYINWGLSTAESTVNSAVEKLTPLATPVAQRMEGPIKKVDSMICSGLDYVETKVPCVKLPPGEMYEKSKNYINDTVTPAVQSACSVVQPAMAGAMQQAANVKDSCVNKVGEYLGKNKEGEDATKGECKNCEKDKCQKTQ